MPRLSASTRHLVAISLTLAAGYFFAAYFAVATSTYFASVESATIEEFRAIELRNGILFGGISASVIGVFIFAFLRRAHLQEERMNRLDESLNEAQQRLSTSTLVHTVVHDTNNLLGVVRSGLTMLSDPDLPIDPAILCARIGTALDRVESLQQQMMSREREVHDQEARLEIFSVREIFDELRSYARLHPRLKDCRLDFRAGKALHIRANRTECTQAILNLVLNAADATENRGHIAVDSLRLHGRVCIRIDDDGPGIAEADRERVFAAFYTSKKHGMGLGLISVKGFCQRSHGRVSIETSRWNGARFVIDLPAVEPVPLDDAPAPRDVLPVSVA